MSRDSIAVGIAGVFFGVIVGWIIGSQQTTERPVPPQASASAPAAAQGGTNAPPPFDATRAAVLEREAGERPSDAAVRAQLGNLYFDADRFPDAAKWYEESLQRNPRDVNVSTDLGITYYYMNQPDRALAQFDHSLQVDPRHSKTLLNVGIVRAFGKQDLKGAAEAWKQVLDVAPAGSDEARAARQALDSVKAAHPDIDVDAPSPKGRSN